MSSRTEWLWGGDDISPNYDDQTVTQLALGLGMKWDIDNDLYLRTELETFDRDALFFSVQLGMYF